MIDEMVESAVNAAIVATMVVVTVFAGAYTFLSGKKHGRSATLRKVTFRCVAATIVTPNAVFRLGVALVAIGSAFAVYYAAYGHSAPNVVKLVTPVGMMATVCASAGVALYRLCTQAVWRRTVTLRASKL